MVVYYGNNDWRDYHLAHHGILGQKWGVRRYQNPDGTLTTAGRERYGRINAKADAYRQRETARLDRRFARKSAGIDKKLGKLADRKANTDPAKEKRLEKITKKEDKLNFKKNYEEGLYKAEKEAVSNLTVEDIKKEKLAVGMNNVRRAMSIASAAGFTMGAINSFSAAKAAADLASMKKEIVNKMTDKINYDSQMAELWKKKMGQIPDLSPRERRMGRYTKLDIANDYLPGSYNGKRIPFGGHMDATTNLNAVDRKYFSERAYLLPTKDFATLTGREADQLARKAGFDPLYKSNPSTNRFSGLKYTLSGSIKYRNDCIKEARDIRARAIAGGAAAQSAATYKNAVGGLLSSAGFATLTSLGLMPNNKIKQNMRIDDATKEQIAIEAERKTYGKKG